MSERVSTMPPYVAPPPTPHGERRDERRGNRADFKAAMELAGKRSASDNRLREMVRQGPAQPAGARSFSTASTQLGSPGSARTPLEPKEQSSLKQSLLARAEHTPSRARPETFQQTSDTGHASALRTSHDHKRVPVDAQLEDKELGDTERSSSVENEDLLHAQPAPPEQSTNVFLFEADDHWQETLLDGPVVSHVTEQGGFHSEDRASSDGASSLSRPSGQSQARMDTATHTDQLSRLLQRAPLAAINAWEFVSVDQRSLLSGVDLARTPEGGWRLVLHGFHGRSAELNRQLPDLREALSQRGHKIESMHVVTGAD